MTFFGVGVKESKQRQGDGRFRTRVRRGQIPLRDDNEKGSDDSKDRDDNSRFLRDDNKKAKACLGWERV
jgi:hypothetical protein